MTNVEVLIQKERDLLVAKRMRSKKASDKVQGLNNIPRSEPLLLRI